MRTGGLLAGAARIDLGSMASSHGKAMAVPRPFRTVRRESVRDICQAPQANISTYKIVPANRPLACQFLRAREDLALLFSSSLLERIALGDGENQAGHLVVVLGKCFTNAVGGTLVVVF